MVGRRPLEKAKDASIDLDPVAGLSVVGLGLVRVAHILRLGSGEVATLTARYGKETAAKIATINRHSTANSISTLVLCKLSAQNYRFDAGLRGIEQLPELLDSRPQVSRRAKSIRNLGWGPKRRQRRHLEHPEIVELADSVFGVLVE